LNYICTNPGDNAAYSTDIINTYDGGFAIIGGKYYQGKFDNYFYKYDSLLTKTPTYYIVPSQMADLLYGAAELSDHSIAVIGEANGYPHTTSTRYYPMYYGIAPDTSNVYRYMSNSYKRMTTNMQGGKGNEIKQVNDSTLAFIGTHDVGSVNTSILFTTMNLLGDNPVHRYYGGGNLDIGQSFVITPNGDYILVGYSRSKDSIVQNHSSNGNADGWVLRTDAAGNVLWKKCYGSTYSDYLLKIVPATTPNEYYLMGSYERPENPADADAWVVKIDGTNGDIQWEDLIGSSADDVFEDGMIDKNGDLVVVGSSQGSPGNHGAHDIWVVKLKDPTVGTTDLTVGNNNLIATPLKNNQYQLTFVGEKAQYPTTLTLTDALGRQIKSIKMEANTTTIDLSMYAQGVYFVVATGYKSVKLVR
jgi:hypothetical protein